MIIPLAGGGINPPRSFETTVWRNDCLTCGRRDCADRAARL